MSNDVTKEQKPNHDFTMDDLQRIEVFKENGMLGLAKLSDVDITKIMDYYMDGMGYREISQILRIDRTTILFLSQKLNFYQMRRTYIEELGVTVRDRFLESKLQSQEFLLKVSNTFKRKIGKNVDRYLRSETEEDAAKINLKEIDKYLKVLESLHRFSGMTMPGEEGAGRPFVGINPGEGMTVKKVGENEIEITPTGNAGAVKSRLKQWADMKRDLEKDENKAPVSHDISKEQTSNEGEDLENDEE